ncbi:MAG: hypothetical protein HY083_01245, partial [Gammaproteobacteria bacterium]|nr:hypothetical protein [Gammaproteobacteria bacterium]
IEETLARLPASADVQLEAILAVDAQARKLADSFVAGRARGSRQEAG